MLRIEYLYWLVGAFLIACAVLNLRERHYSMAAFWLILAGPFVFGDAILGALKQDQAWPAQAMGVGVIALGLLAARGRLRMTADGPGEQEQR
ncbi:MAG: DUF979 family protein, partial [Dokdonella sp.]